MKYTLCHTYTFEDAQKIKNAIFNTTHGKLNPTVMSYEHTVGVLINVKGRMRKERLEFWKGFAEGVRYNL